MVRLVVGLGNPGGRYAGTRHNVGFMALEALRADLGLPELRDKFSGAFARGEALGASLALLEPMTFMNDSGASVQPAMAFLKVAIADLLVLHDEIDLPFGEVRIKAGGGHAGHNGLRSIVERVGSADFVRVRIGVGRPPPTFAGDVAAYVLSGFDAAERAELPGVLSRAVQAAEEVLRAGPEAAMNRFNARGTGAAATAK